MREFSAKEILSVVKDCRVYVPIKSTFTYLELIDFAWTKGYMDISKMSDLSILYLFDKIMSLRVKSDCFGKYFEESNSICKICQLSKRCKVISRIPAKSKIPRDAKSYTISGITRKDPLLKKISKVSVKEQKEYKKKISSLEIDVEQEAEKHKNHINDLIENYNKFIHRLNSLEEDSAKDKNLLANE